MSVFEVTTTITYKYLMGKTKSELAYMYLDLMEAGLKKEKDAIALSACLKRVFDSVEWSEEIDKYVGNVLLTHGVSYLDANTVKK